MNFVFVKKKVKPNISLPFIYNSFVHYTRNTAPAVAPLAGLWRSAQSGVCAPVASVAANANTTLVAPASALATGEHVLPDLDDDVTAPFAYDAVPEDDRPTVKNLADAR